MENAALHTHSWTIKPPSAPWTTPHALIDIQDTKSAEDSEDGIDDDHLVMKEDTPTNTDINLLKKRLFFDHPSTDTQRTVNKNLEDISQPSFTAWIAHLEKKIEDTYSQSKGPQKCNLAVNLFLNQFGKSEKFHEELKKLLHCKDLQSLLAVQNVFFEHKTDDSLEHLSSNNSTTPPKETGYGKLRYVAGMCVGRWSIITPISSPEISEKTVQSHKNIALSLRNHMYNNITIAQQESQYPESSSDIIHRQTQFGHLTIVDDHYSSQPITSVNTDRNYFLKSLNKHCHQLNPSLFLKDYHWRS